MLKRFDSLKIAIMAGALSLGPAALGQIAVEVNGMHVSFPYARPQMIGGRVMIPLRGVLEQMGAYVSWDAGSRTVTARKADTDIEMRIGSRTARVNSMPVSLEVPAMILQGTTMVPLRFVSESLGADVQWVAATQTVRIDTTIAEPSRPPNQPPYRPQPGPVLAISSFTAYGPSGLLQPGQRVHMELRGTPGADVMFVVPGTYGTKRMREDRPGEYSADWTVPDDIGSVSLESISARLLVNGDERTMRATRVNTPPRGDAIPPLISNIEPDNGERIARARPLITARLSDRSGTGLDERSWRLYLDGDDVTDDATLNSGVLRYQPASRLSVGTHRVRLVVEDRSGNRATESWSFVVTRAGSLPSEATLTHNASSQIRTGDTITFTVRTEPEATVTYSLGDLAVNRSMRETSPGVYTATYVVRRGDDLRNVPLTARVRTSDGSAFTVTGERVFGEPAGGTLSAPVILSPTDSDRVRDEIVLRARSANADRYEVKIDYEAFLLGALPVTGTVLQKTYDADSRGELDTGSIRLTNPAGARDITYTVEIVAIGRNGERSESSRITLRR